MSEKLFIGRRVRVGVKHWLRPNETGTIIEIDDKFKNPYLVEFGRKYPSGGLDGNKLWFDEASISPLGDVQEKAASKKRERVKKMNGGSHA